MNSYVNLVGGIIVGVNNLEKDYQDMLEIKLLSGEFIILTASPGGKFKIGKNIDETDSPHKS